MLEAELFAFLEMTGGRRICGDQRRSDLLVEPGCGAAVWILVGGRAEPGVL